ncbi:MAG: methionyl-tRNA formyltransferase [Deltaproteobacteria bacterium]|nr:methionyl-tRNA formyltransferase [Deltaproteobacteria bacterium]
MKTIFMGTPDFAVPTLEILNEHTDLKLVVTQPDKKQGRGKKVVFSPVKDKALELGVDIIQPEIVKGKKFASKIKEFEPDLIVTAAYGKLLGPSLLDVPILGCLNVHASILPRYRGAAPINHAIINGEKEAGVSIMKTVLELDAGDVYLIKKLEIGKSETAGELTKRLSQLGAAALLEVILNFENIIPVKQSDDNKSYASQLLKIDGKIDWSKSARQIDCHIRGVNPWPGAYTLWGDKVVKIHKCEVLNTDESSAPNPGEVIEHSKSGIDISCGKGIIRVINLQLPGKNALTAKQFFSGTRVEQGTILV